MRSLIQTSDAQYQRDKEHLITANSSLQRLHKNQTFLSIKIKLSYKVKKETRRDLFTDCRQSWCWDYSQHHFSVYSASSAKNPNKLKNSDILDALFPRILASFFRFMQAKVSPAFISIRAVPIYWV